MSKITIECEGCGKSETRPEIYKEWAIKEIPTRMMYYRSKLKYCDDCCKKKNEEALILLPEILKILGNEIQE